MIIVVEGADLTGKSLLCEELSQRLNMPIFKRSRATMKGRDMLESQAEDRALMDLIEATEPEVIIERWWPSKVVYDDGYPTQYDPAQAEEMSRRFAALRNKVGVLLAWSEDAAAEGSGLNTEGLGDTIRSRADGDVSVAKVLEANTQYLRLLGDREEWKVFDAGMQMGRLIARVTRELVRHRPLKDEVYMRMAKEAAKRSTCLSRRNGAVLVTSDGHVVATGYNGAPRGMDIPDVCPRLERGLASGSDLEMCDDVHAEENCIVQAAKLGHSVIGSTIYTVMSPCHRCFRMLANAEVAEVVYEREYGDVRAMSMGVPGVRLRAMSEESSPAVQDLPVLS